MRGSGLRRPRLVALVGLATISLGVGVWMALGPWFFFAPAIQLGAMGGLGVALIGAGIWTVVTPRRWTPWPEIEIPALPYRGEYNTRSTLPLGFYWIGAPP